jgi:hypothetical protein
MPKKYYHQIKREVIPKTEEIRYLEEEENLVEELANLTIQNPTKKGKRKKPAKRIRNYYNFLCKCQEKFSAFSEFLDHVKDSHGVRNINFPEILAKRNGSKWGIKFYWGLTCDCGNHFSSSLCNADLKVSNGEIELLKKYRLQCLKCKKYAKFDERKLLDEFLEEKVKQKLIYNFYKKEFEEFKRERDGEKELEGHIEELCEKCKLLGRHCGGK